MQALPPRTITDMKPVLYNPEVTAPADVYWVFTNITQKGDQRFDITILTNELMGREFPKTFGHYHVPINIKETYTVISGNALILLQKPKEGDYGVIVEFRAIKKTTGESIEIPVGYAHAVVNISSDALVLSNWVDSAIDHDYETIAKYAGLAYYIVSEDDQIKFIKNEAYSVVPEVIDHL